ncbi:MAG: DUF3656 domain-containing protein [Methanolobus sp.]|nr:DUF3656 domain-containing protein [Methanolobus sp.]
MLKTPELLAPAGNMESLVAAVENGADAVYLGIRDFSARAYAGNFGIEELSDVLDFAHLRGVKVYVTMNTLIKDSEIKKALDIMYTLDELGADAIIVQDMGLLELARIKVPSLPIHASTQMTTHNTEGVRFLKNMGVKRIVLARELSLEGIAEIKTKTDAEIEVFVHGALCICYSGQCLMSSMIGGRSGNRGYCAQPCRKQYNLRKDGKQVETDGSYLLSPKDLNTSDILPELIKTGMDSFKIEGRMKRPEYVAGVVRIYRRLIDRFAGDPNNYFVTEEEKENLEQLFNRGFTTGYLKADPAGELMSRQRPHNQGIVIGEVTGFNNKLNRMEITLTRELEVGDGIGFEDSRDCGTIIRGIYIGNRLEKKAGTGDIITINFDQPPKNGTLVYRTLDDSLMKELQASYSSPAPIRKVPVSIGFKAHIGEKLELSISDIENNTSTVICEYIVERSQKRPTTEDDVSRQLAKTGNTVFEAQNIAVDMPDDAFIPIKELNNARNKATAELESIRTLKWRRPAHDRSCEMPEKQTEVTGNAEPIGKSDEKRTLLSVTVNSPGNLNSALKSGADLIYIDISLKGLQDKAWKTAISLASERKIPLYLHTPLIVKDREVPKLKETIVLAKELGFEGIVAANTGVLGIASNCGMRILADSSLNVFNRYSLQALEQNGVDTVTLSTEMNLGQITELAKYGDCEYIVHGQIRIMESEHCLIGGLSEQKDDNALNCASLCKSGNFEIVDEKGFEFPVKTDPECRTHIFNSRELCLLDDIPQLIRAGVSRLRADARNMDDKRVAMVTRAYRANIDACYTGETKYIWHGSDINEEHTRGHYHRGVI